MDGRQLPHSRVLERVASRRRNDARKTDEWTPDRSCGCCDPQPIHDSAIVNLLKSFAAQRCTRATSTVTLYWTLY